MAAQLDLSTAAASAAHGRRRLILTLVIVTVAVSALVRIVALDSFPQHVFDEYYYVHDAVALLHGELGPRPPDLWKPGAARSLAHPGLGTLAIAAGIAVLGDDPWGWRLPSALAGIALIALVYPLARRTGLPSPWALAATVLAASDTMLIVESRLGVLDSFVALGTAACIYFALRALQSPAVWRWAVLAGLAGGVAVASKWSGALAILAALAAAALYARRRGARRTLVLAACLVLLWLPVYGLAYLPYFLDGHSLGQWLHLQRYLLGFNTSVHGTLTFASHPVTWIFDAYPIWYRFVLDQRGTVGLLAIGNPLLWWPAAAALVALGVLAVSRRDARLGLAPLLVAVLYLPWLATTRQAFIYYMTPVVPFLAILVATGLWQLAGRRPAACRPQALGFGGGALLTAGGFGLAGLGEGVLTAGGAVFWRVLAGVLGAALAVLAVLDALRGARRSALGAALCWVYVGVVAGLAVAYVPFLVGHPVSFEYYRRLTWFVTWR